MSRGKRFDGNEQLNYKKVLAVILAIIVIIMFVLIVKQLATKAKDTKNTVAINYFALYADNKWGIVDSTGTTTIEPMYQEMIIVLDKSKDVFLCTYDINEDTGEYKTKVINKDNKEILTEYSKVEALENYDSSENAWYEKDILRVQKDGKYGIIDIDGKEILATEYESIETLKGLENSILVKKDGKVGLVNKSGNKIIDTEYKSIENIDNNYKHGYIVTNSDGKKGIISYTGNEVLGTKYDNIIKSYNENYFAVEENGKQTVIDNTGKTILKDGYDSISQVNSDGIVFVKDKKYGFMDFKGKVKVEAEYENLKEINTGILRAKKDGKYGLIDIDEKQKLAFEFSDIYYEEEIGLYITENDKYNVSILDSDFKVQLKGILSELNVEAGYMKLRIGNEYKYYNFKFEEKDVKEILSSNTLYVSKKDEKYGFVDKEGNVVVDYIYDEAQEQNKYGFAAVKKDNLWGAIDMEGKEVVSPKYTLNNNLVIDFIGKWHLGQDLNMNYYCEK